ncbi:unnamed protein product [Diplocarpon coronariae]
MHFQPLALLHGAASSTGSAGKLAVGSAFSSLPLQGHAHHRRGEELVPSRSGKNRHLPPRRLWIERARFSLVVDEVAGIDLSGSQPQPRSSPSLIAGLSLAWLRGSLKRRQRPRACTRRTVPRTLLGPRSLSRPGVLFCFPLGQTPRGPSATLDPRAVDNPGWLRSARPLAAFPHATSMQKDPWPVIEDSSAGERAERARMGGWRNERTSECSRDVSGPKRENEVYPGRSQ